MLPPHTSLLTRRRFLENSALVAACALVPQRSAGAGGARALLQVYDLRCEQSKNPLAVDEPQPLLSWKVSSDRSGVTLALYQVQVATDLLILEQGRPDLWDTKRSQTGEMIGTVYHGRRLYPGERAYWRVKVWGADGTESAWSNPGFWGGGLANTKDWNGQWLGFSEQQTEPNSPNAPVWMFRKEFTLNETGGRVVLYLAAVGIAEPWINGRKVDLSLLEPAVTDLNKRVPYRAYDVSNLVHSGKNTLGIRLGNGFLNSPSAWPPYSWRKAAYAMSSRFLANLIRVEKMERTVLCASDDSWPMAKGEITYNCVWGGEFIDNRLRKPDWCVPTESLGSDWIRAKTLRAPPGKPSVLLMPPCRVTEEIHPVSIKEIRSGAYIADMGVNFTGWIRLRARGQPGRQIRIRISERRNSDGTLDTSYFGIVPKDTPFHEVRIILATTQPETAEPAFSFQSGQYVQIEGLDDAPDKEDITGCCVHNDFGDTGSFSCSSALINQLHSQIRRVLRNNWIGMQFDCPHREKTPWLGDYTRTIQAGSFNFDLASCYAKSIQDILDNQRPEGGLDQFAPTRRGYVPAVMDVWWQGDVWRMPWNHYLYFGDVRQLERAYEPMKAFMKYFLARYLDGFTPPGRVAPNSSVPELPYGDHCSVGYMADRGNYVKAMKGGVPKPQAEKLWRTPVDLLGAMGVYDGATTLSRVAALLGQSEDVDKFRSFATNLREQINRRMDSNTGAYAEDSQTLQALALYYDVPPPEARAKVMSYLVNNIRHTRHGYVSTGTIATRQLYRCLSDGGEGALALEIMHRPGDPGYAGMVARGVTAITESWTGGSLNHPALGGIGDWFYASLAGIRPDPTAPGFRRIIFQPDIGCGLQFARAEYESVRGKIVSDWRIRDGSLLLRIVVPVGSEAKVIFPQGNETKILVPEGAVGEPGEKGKQTFRTGCGTYEFEIRNWQPDDSNAKADPRQ
jgi:alpha-L-rhamnosidase